MNLGWWYWWRVLGIVIVFAKMQLSRCFGGGVGLKVVFRDLCGGSRGHRLRLHGQAVGLSTGRTEESTPQAVEAGREGGRGSGRGRGSGGGEPAEDYGAIMAMRRKARVMNSQKDFMDPTKTGLPEVPPTAVGSNVEEFSETAIAIAKATTPVNQPLSKTKLRRAARIDSLMDRLIQKHTANSTHKIAETHRSVQSQLGLDQGSGDHESTMELAKRIVLDESADDMFDGKSIFDLSQNQSLMSDIEAMVTKESKSSESTTSRSQSAATSTASSSLPQPDRPFTLPSKEFKPKQSLGQNYLNDQNTVNKFIDCFANQRKLRLPHEAVNDKTGHRVVEIGPGAGALTRKLIERYPDMLAIEVDRRSIDFLAEKLPTAHVIHQDVLEFDWRAHYWQRISTNAMPATSADDDLKTTTIPALVSPSQGLSIVANLPYHIVSQVLFSLADNHDYVSLAVVTMQLEVALRITAKPRTPEYGIPSIIFQLYGETLLNFKIPPTVFYPVPKVDSALVTIDFTKPHKDLKRVHGLHLRKVVTAAFRQRRKMMRQSLKELLAKDKLTLPEKWATLRPQELTPPQFIQLTIDLYGEKTPSDAQETNDEMDAIWRRTATLFD